MQFEDLGRHLAVLRAESLQGRARGDVKHLHGKGMGLADQPLDVHRDALAPAQCAWYWG
jgi:hypothetical protein